MNNIFKPLINGFFRKIGNVLAIIFILYIISILVVSNNIKLPDFLKPIFTYVKADEITNLYYTNFKYGNYQIPYDSNSDTYLYGFDDVGPGRATRFFKTSIQVPANTYYMYVKVYHSMKIALGTNVELGNSSNTILGNTYSNDSYILTLSVHNYNWSNCEVVHSTNNNIAGYNIVQNIGYDTFKCPIDKRTTSIDDLAISYVATIAGATSLGFNPNFSFLVSSDQGIISEQEATTQAIENLNDSVNDVNNSINDDTTDEATDEASDFFNNFENNTHGLTGIITAPLNAINNLTSSSCSPLVLPLPFVNKNLSLPCMRSIYLEHFSNFMNVYDIITLGIVSYWIMVRLFALVKGFKDPENDKIEVVDL